MYGAGEKLYILPMLLDKKEAVRFLADQPLLSDAVKAYVCGLLHKSYGLKNRELRPIFGIARVYSMTHLIRVGSALTDEEFLLWHNNSSVLTLGHMRCLCHLPTGQRLRWIREVLARRLSVSSLHGKVWGGNGNKDKDIASYENLVSDKLGRPVNIKYLAQKQTGDLVLTFFGLDDLDDLLEKLGYAHKSDD